MFADNINFFLIYCKFRIGKNKSANKLSINIKKNISLQRKQKFFKDEIPLKLPGLMISNNNVERKS